MSFRFPISLSGTNEFRRNEGGGISLMQSRVDVGGAVHFIKNSAVVGGGMALEDQCLVMHECYSAHCLYSYIWSNCYSTDSPSQRLRDEFHW